jgi:hypothetical protein
MQIAKRNDDLCAVLGQSPLLYHVTRWFDAHAPPKQEPRMPRIHVRGGRPLAGYNAGGQRINVVKGDYDAHLVENLFPQDAVPHAALEISGAHGPNPLFVKCTDYTNEIEWDQFPDGGHPYFVPA